MNPESLIALTVLIVILYIAFRVGAVLMRLALGLLAIGIVAWLVMRLVAAPQ